MSLAVVYSKSTEHTQKPGTRTICTFGKDVQWSTRNTNLLESPELGWVSLGLFVSVSELSNFWPELATPALSWTQQSLVFRMVATTACRRNPGPVSLGFWSVNPSDKVLFSHKLDDSLDHNNKHKTSLFFVAGQTKAIDKACDGIKLPGIYVPREHTFLKSPVSSHHWTNWIDHPFLWNILLCIVLQNHVLSWAHHQLWTVLWKKNERWVREVKAMECALGPKDIPNLNQHLEKGPRFFTEVSN